MKKNTVKLAEGNYTGELKNVINTNHFIVSTTNYTATECDSTLHNHKNPHICLLYQGEDIECKKDLVPYKRKAGDMFYYRAGENHKTISTLKDSKNINIEFKTNTLLDSDFSFNIDFDVDNNNPILKSALLRMLYELLINDCTSPIALEFTAFRLLKLNDNFRAYTKPKWALDMDEYLNEYWANDFSLIELAQAIRVHPITISKNFKKYYTCTYGEYRRILKVHNSIPLIKNGNRPLSQIAYECGFSDQSHFIRNFKKYSAFRPMDFRRL